MNILKYNKNMRILCLSRAPLDYKGGIPKYCLNLYKNSYTNISVYNYDIEKKLNRTIRKDNFNISETTFPSEICFGTIAFSFRYLFAIIRNPFKFSILHIQHPDPLSSVATLLVKLINWKIKIIITWHAEVYSNYKLISPFLFILDLILFSISSKVIYFTPFHVKDSLLSKIYFIKKKIILIDCCVDNPVHSSDIILRNRSNDIVNKKNINLLSIGRLVSYKGYEFSIRAIKDCDKKVVYNIIGNGPLRNKLTKLINNLGLEKRIFILENISDDEKMNYLLNSDIFLFPSINKSEAYGLVQLEAISYALPVINTMLNNGVNYLLPNNVALTCNPRDSMGITESIKKLSSENKTYNNLSLRSYDRFSFFNISKMRMKFFDLIEKI